MSTEMMINSFDGMKLYLKKDLPEAMKAVVVVVHGLCEHQGRYDYLVDAFNKRGLGTYRFDHRGHGRSEGERTYYNDFNEMTDDVNVVVELAKAENPDVPVFLLGHSMGGFAVATYACKYPGMVKGIVLSGGLTHDNRRLVSDLPAMDPHTQLPNELGDGVCSVKEVVEYYGIDPYNTKTFTAGLVYQLIAGIAWMQDKFAGFEYPVLLLHGEKDALVSNTDSKDFFNKIASKDRQIKIYGNLFHEIFNEYCHDEVIDDAIRWIEFRI